jgi:hypothetical protein
MLALLANGVRYDNVPQYGTAKRLMTSTFQRTNNPVITVYEAQANLADHEKIQGMGGTSSTPQS